MYKAKLQELCQKRKWGMPKYSSMKCGPDHDPRFGATVSVNSTSFDSLIPCKSSKLAHNHVAMLAFLHFTNSPLTTTSTITTSGSEVATRGPVTEESSRNLDVNSNVLAVRSDPAIPIIKPDEGGPKVEETPLFLKNLSDTATATVIDDIHCQYKIQLQKYAKQRKLGLPSYSGECDGARASRFKAKVTVGKRVFESLKFFNTSKEAENAAAQAALMSLLVESCQKEESGPYKNLLQELAQGEGFSIPLYKTTNCGAPHRPVFKSIVELEGEVFQGKAANSKKLAELDASRVAYVALMKRASARIAASGTSFEHESQLVPYPTQTYVKHVKEKNDSEQGLSSNTAEKSSSLSSASSPIEGHVSPSVLNSNTRNKTTAVTLSYLLCNKVRVYQVFPNHAFPKGITVMPIGDHKWVAVSLEFPNEGGN